MNIQVFSKILQVFGFENMDKKRFNIMYSDITFLQLKMAIQHHVSRLQVVFDKDVYYHHINLSFAITINKCVTGIKVCETEFKMSQSRYEV